MIILHKKTQIIRIPKQRPLDRNFLHIIRLRDMQDLCRSEISPIRGDGREIEIVAVVEKLQGGRARGRGRGTEEDGVEFEDAGETNERRE